MICENRINKLPQLRRALTHELIHAHDNCVGVCGQPSLDWDNPRHHACTEIRAAHLSGDCTRMQELARGNVKRVFTNDHDCVRRRAALSLSMRPIFTRTVVRHAHTIEVICTQKIEWIYVQTIEYI